MSIEEIQPNLDGNADLKLPSAPAAHRKSVKFIAGTVLMAASFLVYPAYPVIILWLPLSASAKAGVSVAVWVLSWGTFSAGAYFAGPEGYQFFKGLWRCVVGGRGRQK